VKARGLQSRDCSFGHSRAPVEGAIIIFSFRVSLRGALNSGGVSHKKDGLSNSHGVPGVPGEEILTNDEF
jgi:hypothetical protein